MSDRTVNDDAHALSFKCAGRGEGLTHHNYARKMGEGGDLSLVPGDAR